MAGGEEFPGIPWTASDIEDNTPEEAEAMQKLLRYAEIEPPPAPPQRRKLYDLAEHLYATALVKQALPYGAQSRDLSPVRHRASQRLSGRLSTTALAASSQQKSADWNGV